MKVPPSPLAPRSHRLAGLRRGRASAANARRGGGGGGRGEGVVSFRARAVVDFIEKSESSEYSEEYSEYFGGRGSLPRGKDEAVAELESNRGGFGSCLNRYVLTLTLIPFTLIFCLVLIPSRFSLRLYKSYTVFRA